MKKLLTLLLLAISVQLFAQSYPITSITISLPANPDANTANWGSGTSLFMISATAKGVNGRVDITIESSKILVTIKKGGSKICGIYTSGSAPSANFNALTKVWRGSSALSLLGQDCTLPAGDYELSVQFFGNGPTGLMALSEERTKGFTIRGNEQQVYQAPQALMPTNGTAFKEADLQKPISFRWTPIVPRPQEPTTYRLKVWQLMQGQNAAQTMRVNQPIITKDVDNLTQATANNIITGPCKPPYLCDFVWNIQALNRDGKPIGSNNGTSELMTFSGTATETAIAPPTLKQPANGETIATGKQQVFSWQAPIPTPSGAVTYKIKIVEIKGDQSPEAAFRTNKPHFERDSSWDFRTNKPFFEKDSIELLNIPYPSSATAFVVGKQYAWAVSIIDKSGNQKWSQVSVFSVPNCNVNLKLQLQSIECLKTVNGFSIYKVCVAANYNSTNYNLTYSNASSGFKVYAPSYSPTYSITNLSPSLQVQNSGTTSTVNYCFEVSVPVGQTAIKIGLQGDDKDPGPITCQPGAELEINRLPSCPPPCACGTWGNLEVQNSPLRGYKCGSEIVWKCGQDFKFSNTFACLPNDATCVAKTEWVITKDGQPYTNGSGLSGSFTPTVNGVYTITLKATCNGKECQPCEYKVIVKDCPPPCACGTWGTLTVGNGNGEKPYKCGDQIIGSCNKSLGFSSIYQCSPSNASCVAETKWTISKNNMIIGSGNGSAGSFVFTANGTYTLTLKAKCNGKECPPCTYTIIINDCVPPCECGTWGNFLVKDCKSEEKVACDGRITKSCNSTITFANTFSCGNTSPTCIAKTDWKVEKNGTTISSGSGLVGALTFTSNGIYTITLNAECNGKKCKPCTFTVVVTDCK